MQPAVSIIVAMFKVEQYLAACLDSLLGGTLREVEFILINDGSPDRCGEIAEEYAKRDPRIRVIHQRNGGLSQARNKGLRLATGEYVGFVDPDDWIEKDMFAELYKAAVADNADGCICSFYEFYEGSEEAVEVHYPFLPPLAENKAQVLSSVMLPLIAGRLHSFAWNKLYRRSLLLQHDVLSPEDMPLMQDTVFNQAALGIMDRIAYVDRPLYHFRRHPASNTMKFRPDLFVTLLRLRQEKEQFLFRQAAAKPEALASVQDWFIRRTLHALQVECSSANPLPHAEQNRRIEAIIYEAGVRRILSTPGFAGNPFDKGLLLALRMRSVVAVRFVAASYRLARRVAGWLRETAASRSPGRTQVVPGGGDPG